ncbi:uncharacterized acetyltransferase At3g50280-like [Asparagus officinalis]|uniref:uncharacterized acetyltransferase At3g50280-like n=1 Tax=Asparagus officinalis TaxID=4686 RepID=UPI00098E707B|nr:uncharacterized acetyltransferase At3g50280-like [Asparagus officinalis]
MGDAGVTIISKQIVQPSPKTDGGGGVFNRRIHLTPWDLKMLPFQYIQKGILFHNPTHSPISSPPFQEDGSISVSLDCTGEGAEFIHASAPHVSVSDIQTPSNYHVPPVVRSFFPLNGILDCDGHSYPLLGVQVTELADGIFIACSLNHSAADGTTFWQFFKTWSTICRNDFIGSPPEFDRWFPDSIPRPIHLPFKDHREFIRGTRPRNLGECTFSFSAENIKKLKDQARPGKISSLQALLAHVWRSMTRASGLQVEKEPPLPETYVGNSLHAATAKASAGEIQSNGLGWTALRLKEAIAAESEASAICGWVEAWIKNPSFLCLDLFTPGSLYVSGSPRFDVYGNDFGWGKPVAVRTGPGNKVDGRLELDQGREEGGVDIEICSTVEVLSSLISDGEFTNLVS